MRRLVILLCLPLPLAAQEPECKTLSTGDTFCVVQENGVKRWVPQRALGPRFAVGDDFPIYDHSMLMDLNRYDLSPVDGHWRYYIVEGIIYKVDPTSKTVIEVVKRHFAR